MESRTHLSHTQETHSSSAINTSTVTAAVEPLTILFMVGTHHFPFTRLLTWADTFAESHPEVHVLVQHGETPHDEFPTRPNLTWARSLTHAEMDTLQPLAVVLPAGPSLMMEWTRRGYKPFVVARDPQLGEHIDEHQQLFARDMSALGLINAYDEYEMLKQALEQSMDQGKPFPTEERLLAEMGTPTQAAEHFGQLIEQLIKQ